MSSNDSTRGWHYIVACTPTCNQVQDLDPSNFHAWPLDCTKNSALTLDYSSVNHAHWVPGEALTVSKLVWAVCLTPWPASKFRFDCLTSLWPRSWVGVQSPMQCHPLVVHPRSTVLYLEIVFLWGKSSACWYAAYLKTVLYFYPAVKNICMQAVRAKIRWPLTCNCYPTCMCKE